MVDVSRLGAFHGFVDQAAYEADQADRERRRQAAESRKAVGVGWYVSILSSVECTGEARGGLVVEDFWMAPDANGERKRAFRILDTRTMDERVLLAEHVDIDAAYDDTSAKVRTIRRLAQHIYYPPTARQARTGIYTDDESRMVQRMAHLDRLVHHQ